MIVKNVMSLITGYDNIRRIKLDAKSAEAKKIISSAENNGDLLLSAATFTAQRVREDQAMMELQITAIDIDNDYTLTLEV